MFENDTCTMVQGVMVLMQGIRIRNLYKLLGKTNVNSYNKAVDPETDEIISCVADSIMLWHRQLGHISKNGLGAMHRKGMVEGLPDCSSEFDFCEHCIYGKQNHVRFPRKDTR